MRSHPFTCKTLLSDSSPVLTSTFSKMHFLAVALVYAAADSSKDSDTLFAGVIKQQRDIHTSLELQMSGHKGFHQQLKCMHEKICSFLYIIPIRTQIISTKCLTQGGTATATQLRPHMNICAWHRYKILCTVTKQSRQSKKNTIYC